MGYSVYSIIMNRDKIDVVHHFYNTLFERILKTFFMGQLLIIENLFYLLYYTPSQNFFVRLKAMIWEYLSSVYKTEMISRTTILERTLSAVELTDAIKQFKHRNCLSIPIIATAFAFIWIINNHRPQTRTKPKHFYCSLRSTG